MSNLLKNLLIAFVLAALIWGGYEYFIKADDSPREGAVSLTSDAELETQRFLGRLQLLNSIDISGDIFSDPRFNSLVDHRQDITPEPVGRENPFAPI